MRNKLLIVCSLLALNFLQAYRPAENNRKAPDCTAVVAQITNNTTAATVNYVNIIGCTQNTMNVIGLPPMTGTTLNQTFTCATLTVKVAMAGPFSFIGVYPLGSGTPSSTVAYNPFIKQIYTLTVPFCAGVELKVY